MSDPRTMQVGDRFEGGYRIIGELGRGASSTVYLGEHVDIGQRVAIKVMDSPSERVTREGRVLARLSSPNTVRLLGFGRTPHDEQYMIFEWVDGESLKDFLERRAPVHWEQAREVVRQVLVSLAEAHAQNVTHRDIKPTNVMVNSNLDVKVLDFGVAKMHDAPSITAAHQVPGTPRYMAPEVLRAGAVTPAADVFATGLIGYELLTSEHPNPYRELDQILDAQMAPAPFLLPATVQLPHAVRAWFERLMAKDVGVRFADANEALSAMPEVDETTHEQRAVDEPMPPRRASLEETVEARVKPLNSGSASSSLLEPKPEPVGKEKNRPPSKFLWPTMELPIIKEESWSVTVMLAGFLMLAALVLAGLYQAGAFDPPKPRRAHVNPLVPDMPTFTPESDGGLLPSEHMRPSTRGINHFDRGEYVDALKEFHKIEQNDNTFEKEAIERGNYAQRALDAIAEQAIEDARAAETLEDIEAAAHDPHIAQSLYRGDPRINAIVSKLRKMGREAEQRIEQQRKKEREANRKRKR